MGYTIMSNVHEGDSETFGQVVVTPKEKARLRELAKQWMQIAKSDDIKIKKRQWKAVRDLKPERPMILFETFAVSGFVVDEELSCQNELLRNVEKSLIYGIKQYNELGDDIVLEEYFRLPVEDNQVRLRCTYRRASCRKLNGVSVQFPYSYS